MNLRLLITLINLHICALVIGQNTTEFDSIKQQIEVEKVDTHRAMHLIRLGELTYQSQPDTAVYYWKQALEISERSQFINGITISLSNITYIINQQGKPKKH